MTPSRSTVASVGLGIPVATILSWVVSLTGVTIPDNVEVAFGVVVSAAIGYFFRGGQAADNKEP